MPPVGTSLASEMPNRGCPPKEGIHQTRGSAWWHACHQVVPTREWTPASQRPNVLKYEVREKRRSGKKGKEGGNHWRGESSVGGERQGEERGAESQQRVAKQYVADRSRCTLQSSSGKRGNRGRSVVPMSCTANSVRRSSENSKIFLSTAVTKSTNLQTYCPHSCCR